MLRIDRSAWILAVVSGVLQVLIFPRPNLYPLAWMAEGWAVWRLGGGAALAIFTAALAPSGFFALGWSERLGRVARDSRAWLHFLADRDLHRHLAERRRAIMRELGELFDLVPASELSSAQERGV